MTDGFLRSLALVAALGVGSAGLSFGASHSDAPLIKQDPQANITDVYAFVGTKFNDSNENVLNVVVHVRPFSEPGDGPHYDRFADDALYSIHITDPTTGETRLRYNFQFSGVAGGVKNPETILSFGQGTEAGAIVTVGDARQNYTQTYRVERVGGGSTATLGSGLVTAPPNLGKRATPLYNDVATGAAISGATTFVELDGYTQQTIHDVSSGEAVFAGPREDGFYADIAGVFDLFDPRILDNNGDPTDGLGQDGGGVDAFKGYNVLAYAIQIPVDDLNASPFESAFSGPQTGVGVYASVSRKRIRILNSAGASIQAGPWVQVNRMGNPLFNEAFVTLKDKDHYNRTSPTGDSANFETYALNPKLATLMNGILGTSMAETGRTDLSRIYIPDVVRVATTTGPVRLAGQSGFSRLGFFGGDVTDGVSGSWPNGRRFGDDVVDIALTALNSGPSYTPTTVLGDNVAANDQIFHQVFPYSATPHAGTQNRKDP
jgi:hypothetical protein